MRGFREVALGGGVERWVGGVDFVGEVLEHRAGDGAAVVIAGAGVGDDHDAGVLGVVGGEISGEGGPVAAVVAIGAGDPGGAGFARHAVGAPAEDGAGGAVATGSGHPFHHALAGGEGGGAAHGFGQDHGVEGLDRAAVALEGFDELGLEDLASTGHGIHERQRLQGRLRHLVADGHLGQTQLRPPVRAHLPVNLRFRLARQRNARPFRHAQGGQPVEEGLRLLAEGLLDGQGRAHVRTHLKHLLDGQVAVPAPIVVRVVHFLAVEGGDAVAGGDDRFR